MIMGWRVQKGHFFSGIATGKWLMFMQVTLCEPMGQRERVRGRGWEEKALWKWEENKEG